MFKVKPVTMEEFAEIKLLHNHKWKFLGRQTKGRDRRVVCRCEGCGTEHSVIWRWIKEGKTKQCKFCAKKPDIKRFNEHLKKNGIKWELSGHSRIRKRDGVSLKRREYWCKCTECGRSKWLTWSGLQQLLTPMCRSCSMRLKYSGSTKRPNPIERDLLLRYKHFKWGYAKKFEVHWETFEAFKEWALANGYRPGRRMIRRNTKGPYSPDNCYFTNTLHEAKHPANRELNAAAVSYRQF